MNVHPPLIILRKCRRARGFSFIPSNLSFYLYLRICLFKYVLLIECAGSGPYRRQHDYAYVNACSCKPKASSPCTLRSQIASLAHSTYAECSHTLSFVTDRCNHILTSGRNTVTTVPCRGFISLQTNHKRLAMTRDRCAWRGATFTFSLMQSASMHCFLERAGSCMVVNERKSRCPLARNTEKHL